MKKLLQYAFVLVVIGWSAYFIYGIISGPCSRHLEYRVGRFDSQFGISEEQFKSYITEAEKVWEGTLKRNFFIYDPDADFKINLIYDQRQLATIQKQKTEFGLLAVEEVFKKLDAEFSVFKKRYEGKVSIYEKSLTVFNERKSAYEREVVFWNSKGGAPKEKYELLEIERRYLNTEAERLNTEAYSINTMAKELNTLLGERNAKASEYNRVAEAYNKKYNQGLEFNQAEYNDKEINIYQFGSKKDLILAISHEFGHALGMGHVENPQSVMYYLSDSTTQISPALSAEDLAELKKVCKFK